ncbi:MAG: DUF3159 domain-containing protein [Chloroflexi bacterium]|nr:DUF3159 domain-containing protein [Chloroflexota bacterium]
MAGMGRGREIVEELRTVMGGRSHLIDALVPPVIFAVANAIVGFRYAAGVALALALLFTGWRIAKRHPVAYAIAGLAGVGIAVLLAWLLQRAEGYFLPDIIGGAATVLVCLVSVAVRRPLVALTSHIVRGWPLGWYWHARVRPAYSEVTGFWTLFFAAKLAVQIALFLGASATVIAGVNIVLGWPATIVLLVASYLYGTWRLRQLAGPSVQEYVAAAAPPWSGQERGF